MARYASGNQLNLKVGVSSFSKDLTSLEVVGRVGINSAQPQNELDVAGSVNITDGLSVTGLSTFTGVGTFVSDLYVGGDLYVADDITLDEVTARNVDITGVGTVATLNVTGDTGIGGSISVTGVSTFTGIVTSSTTLFANRVSVAGPSTFTGVGTFVGDLYVGGDLYVADDIVYDEVNGRNLNISGIATIGTKLVVNGPADLVDTVVSGALTATTFTGAGTGLTGITSATNATNIYGGNSGQLLYQAEPGITSAFESGSVNLVLASRGTGNPPAWVAAAPSGAIEGILLFDEGAQVGAGVTYSGIDFRGLDVVCLGGNDGGIATVTVSQQNYVAQAGVATAVIGGGASVTSLSNSGITTLTGSLIVGGTTRAEGGLNVTGLSTFAGVVNATSVINGNGGLNVTGVTTLGVTSTTNLTAENLNVTGITTIGTSLDVNGPSSLLDTVVTGVVTATQYVGDGIRLSGIVTTITAGPNISINANTGNVTITGLANTAIIVADSLFVAGVSTFQKQMTAADINSTGVITATNYFGNGDTLSGVVTSLVAGNNIALSGSQGQVTITGLANTANVSANTLVVTGVSTLGIITGAESLGVGTVYGSNFVGGTFSGTNANFSGNVTIGGTLTYEDVTSVDAVGFITAREGLNVGFETGNSGIGVTILASGNGVFAGIVTVAGNFNVGSASSQFTVQQTATTVEVGIGTIDPNYNLDVRGTANVEGELTVNGNTVPSLAMVVALGGL